MIRTSLIALSISSPLLCVGSAHAENGDLITHDIVGFASWFTDTHVAYAFGNEHCNVGDAPLVWNASTPAHPVVIANLHRSYGGRFQQIGMSWAKHEFCALDIGGVCGTCQPVGCGFLGIGCSDVTSAQISGSQFFLGPRSEIDATTGAFPFPFTEHAIDDFTSRRLRVDRADIDRQAYPGARYFVELQHMHPDDSPDDAGLSANNVSYREVMISESGAILGFVSETVMELPAIVAWSALDSGVHIEQVELPDEGNYWVASRAVQMDAEHWRYDYVVFNLDSHRSVGAFKLDVAASIDVSAIEFHDVDSHSGDIWDSTDWSSVREGDVLRWLTEDFGANPNANALRWGTAYDFHFIADAAPVVAPVVSGAELTFFRPGAVASFPASVIAPSDSSCPSDIDGDEVTGFADLLLVLGAWGPCAAPCAEDLDGDEIVSFADLLIVLGAWGPCA